MQIVNMGFIKGKAKIIMTVYSRNQETDRQQHHNQKLEKQGTGQTKK